jgi:hypothetical protein
MNESTFIENRTVAFLDILGFKKIMEKYKLKHIGQWLDSLIPLTDELQKSERGIFNPNHEACVKFVFSDTIIICSANNTPASFLATVYYIKRLVQSAIVGGAMIRGVVTFGEMYINENNGIFAGIPIVKASELEKNQEWVGIIFDEMVQKEFKEIFDSTVEIETLLGKRPIYSYPDIVKHKVPFKCGATHAYYALNWLDKFPISTEMGSPKEIIQKAMGESEKQHELKYKNTIEYIDYINSIFEYSDNG